MALARRARGTFAASTLLVLLVSLAPPLAAPVEASCAPLRAWRVLEPRDPRLALPETDEVVLKVERAFVELVVHPPQGAAGPGDEAPYVASAIPIDGAGHLVTAAHVVDGPWQRLEAITGDGQVHPVAVLGRDPGQDLALLGIGPAAGLVAADLRRADPAQEGEPVIALGAARDLARPVAVCRVVDGHADAALAYRGYAIRQPMILRISIATGFSGGPVVDRDGRVLGMTASFNLDHYYGPFSTGTAYAVPLAAILPFCEETLARLAAEGCTRPAQAGG